MTDMMRGEFVLDSVWGPALDAFAQSRHMTIAQAVGVLIRQGLQQDVDPVSGKRRALPGLKQTCVVCDESFEVQPGRHAVQLYCSIKCKKYVQNYKTVSKAREMFQLAKVRASWRG